MTPAEVRERAPRSWQIYVMRVEQRMGLGPIAVKLGISIGRVVNGAKRARQLLELEVEPQVQREPNDCRRFLGMKDGTRCKCGLLLPCECLAPLFRVAAERNGESAGEF